LRWLTDEAGIASRDPSRVDALSSFERHLTVNQSKWRDRTTSAIVILAMTILALPLLIFPAAVALRCCPMPSAGFSAIQGDSTSKVEGV
jgi:hypothetical protein